MQAGSNKLAEMKDSLHGCSLFAMVELRDRISVISFANKKSAKKERLAQSHVDNLIRYRGDLSLRTL